MKARRNHVRATRSNDLGRRELVVFYEIQHGLAMEWRISKGAEGVGFWSRLELLKENVLSRALWAPLVHLYVF